MGWGGYSFRAGAVPETKTKGKSEKDASHLAWMRFLAFNVKLSLLYAVVWLLRRRR